MNKEDTEIGTKVLSWLAAGQTGISSEAMAFAASGADDGYRTDTPSDPADFNRCLLLIEQIPEIRDKFSEIEKISDEWSVIIKNWDAIEKSFIDEVGLDWCNGNRAPKTYALMRRFRGDD